jgi:hypothetical protein
MPYVRLDRIGGGQNALAMTAGTPPPVKNLLASAGRPLWVISGQTISC